MEWRDLFRFLGVLIAYSILDLAWTAIGLQLLQEDGVLLASLVTLLMAIREGRK